MKYIFGPVPSRRFGISLGVDLSPNEKICNFDCLYCELPPAKKTNIQNNPAKVKDIINDIEEALRKYKNIEVITITANGEPTLYPYLSELIDEINLIKEDKKSLILSNGSTIYNKNIQNSLKKLDIVKLSLDCISNEAFKKLDRPIEIDTKKMINAMIEFRKIFKNSLIIEILFVKNINDNIKEIEGLNRVLQEIKPNRVDLSSIDRPPAYKVEGLNYEELLKISENFKNLNVNIASRVDKKVLKNNFNKDDILTTLKKRPLTRSDIDLLFDELSIKTLQKLVNMGVIEVKNISGVRFYKKA